MFRNSSPTCFETALQHVSKRFDGGTIPEGTVAAGPSSLVATLPNIAEMANVSTTLRWALQDKPSATRETRQVSLRKPQQKDDHFGFLGEISELFLRELAAVTLLRARWSRLECEFCAPSRRNASPVRAPPPLPCGSTPARARSAGRSDPPATATGPTASGETEYSPNASQSREARRLCPARPET
eukprot:1141927-Prorocentrum_minimum.AAC.6